jgi:hypothetical protein
MTHQNLVSLYALRRIDSDLAQILRNNRSAINRLQGIARGSTISRMRHAQPGVHVRRLPESAKTPYGKLMDRPSTSWERVSEIARADSRIAREYRDWIGDQHERMRDRQRAEQRLLLKEKESLTYKASRISKPRIVNVCYNPPSYAGKDNILRPLANLAIELQGIQDYQRRAPILLERAVERAAALKADVASQHAAAILSPAAVSQSIQGELIARAGFWYRALRIATRTSGPVRPPLRAVS